MSSAPLSDQDVLTQVRDLVGQGRVSWTWHALERMAERCIDKSDVKECLSNGIFAERPHVPNRGGDVEYAFRMQAVVDGEGLAVVASLVPSTRVVVISTFTL